MLVQAPSVEPAFRSNLHTHMYTSIHMRVYVSVYIYMLYTWYIYTCIHAYTRGWHVRHLQCCSSELLNSFVNKGSLGKCNMRLQATNNHLAAVKEPCLIHTYSWNPYSLPLSFLQRWSDPSSFTASQMNNGQATITAPSRSHAVLNAWVVPAVGGPAWALDFRLNTSAPGN